MLNKSAAERLEKVLGPLYGPIREAILKGFRYRQKRYAEELSNHTARTRASLINDLIVNEFLKLNLKQLGVRPFKVQNRILFDIQGEMILHFKKLNRHLQSSNLQTEFAYAFTQQMELLGVPSSLPRLVAGYVPSGDFVNITDVCVTLPKGKKVEWSRSLLEQAEPTINLEDHKNENPQRRRRLKRRSNDQQQKPNESTGTEGG
jgi:hypothetical protein